MDMEQLKEFVRLEKLKKDLDAKLKATKQQIDELEEALVPQFVNDGVQSLRVDGRTVYIAQDIFASPVNDREEVIQALRLSKLEQYVSENYNSQSLSAFVREIARDVEAHAKQENTAYTEQDVQAALPGTLGQALKVLFKHVLRSRSA